MDLTARGVSPNDAAALALKLASGTGEDPDMETVYSWLIRNSTPMGIV